MLKHDVALFREDEQVFPLAPLFSRGRFRGGLPDTCEEEDNEDGLDPDFGRTTGWERRAVALLRRGEDGRVG